MITGVGGWKKSQKENLVKLMVPLAPFLAEELWYRLSHKDSIHIESWPEYDPEMAKPKQGVIVVQINGKVKDRIADGPDVEQRALASDKIKEIIGRAKYRTIFVPGKIINFVINGK